MDLFLLPSLFEGLGMVLIEAQISGIKCIASNSVPKEADITGNVTFLDTDDPQEWANHIIEAMSYTRSDMSSVVASSHYNIKKEAQVLEQKYLSLIKL